MADVVLDVVQKLAKQTTMLLQRQQSVECAVGVQDNQGLQAHLRAHSLIANMPGVVYDGTRDAAAGGIRVHFTQTPTLALSNAGFTIAITIQPPKQQVMDSSGQTLIANQAILTIFDPNTRRTGGIKIDTAGHLWVVHPYSAPMLLITDPQLVATGTRHHLIWMANGTEHMLLVNGTVRERRPYHHTLTHSEGRRLPLLTKEDTLQGPLIGASDAMDRRVVPYKGIVSDVAMFSDHCM